MRLGLNWIPVRSQQELEAALPLIDELGLGAIAAPREMAEWSLAECAAYGEMVRSLGLIISEVGYWQSLLVDDEEVRSQRIDAVRSLLLKADAMHIGCVVTLVGSFYGDKAVAPHAENWSDRAASVHAKDLLWDPTHMFIRLDEVMPATACSTTSATYISSTGYRPTGRSTRNIGRQPNSS